MERTSMERTAALGTDFWNDSCDLQELTEALANGAVGATSNPVIVSTVVKHDLDRWGPVIDRLAAEGPQRSEIEIAWMLVERVGKEAAGLLLPVFEASGGTKGRLSVQVDPMLYRNSSAMVRHAEALAALAPNIAVKVPVTAAGLQAAEEMTARGISVTATVSFTVAQTIAAAEAVERGMERAARAGIDTGAMAPSAVVMVGRLDDHLKRTAARRKVLVDPGCLEWAGVAVVKKLYGLFQRRGYRSRILVAAYRNHMHWSEFVGGDIALTIPYGWWKRFDASDIPVEARMEEPVDERILQILSSRVPDFGRAYAEEGLAVDDFAAFGATVHTLTQFIEGYAELLALIRGRMLVEA